MNILEAYIKFNEQLIILISGFQGSGKGKLADQIKSLFKIDIINTNKYFIENYNKTVKLNDGTEVVDWDDIESINWKRLNKDINNKKKEGIIIVGFAFPTDKLEFSPDFHLHVKISKQNLIERRHEYIEQHPDTKLKELNDSHIDLMILNQITFPHYINYNEKSKINKFLNANEHTSEELFDISYEYMIEEIQKFINEYNKKITENKKNEHIKPREYEDPKIKSYKTKEPIRPNDLIKIVPYDYNEDSESDDKSIIEDDSESVENIDDEESIYLGTETPYSTLNKDEFNKNIE
jgi:uridine kinase